jgi:hypothetical protein
MELCRPPAMPATASGIAIFTATDRVIFEPSPTWPQLLAPHA